MTDMIQKLTAAALEVGGKLKADKVNKEQNYGYISADKILSICGQALYTQGIAVLPEVVNKEVNLYEYTDNYGKVKRRYDVMIDMLFTVTDGTTMHNYKWLGCGSDYMVPDKALYKAITSGHKYFLMKLFCIGEGNEDSEHENEPEEPKRQEQPAKTAPVQQAKPEQPAQPESNGNDKVIAWLIREGLADSDFSAKGMVKLWGKGLTEAADKTAFMVWAKLYRGWRDAGVDSKAAAENAHAGAELK